MAIIGFDTVKSYLDAVAVANGKILNSPHQDFWNVDYDTFKNGMVPGTLCKGKPIPNIDKNSPTQSPFFLIMTQAAGWCNKPQMPKGGPFITSDNQQFVLADGTFVLGKKIRDDLALWLSNGFPKDPV